MKGVILYQVLHYHVASIFFKICLYKCYYRAYISNSLNGKISNHMINFWLLISVYLPTSLVHQNQQLNLFFNWVEEYVFKPMKIIFGISTNKTISRTKLYVSKTNE